MMKLILKLTRISMSSAIAFSAVAGCIFYSKALTWTALLVYLGVLMLAGAATAINQYQEKDQDALMSRTSDRPLPAKLMKPETALILALFMLIAGLTILWFFTTKLTALLGLFNIIWYNGVYTPLKKRTGFVVIVGAVTGSIPPVMGWTAAGGHLLDPKIMFIAVFFFLWQIPHFLLLLLKYKEDYAKAGFRSATTTMSDQQIRFIVFIWILGTSIITMFFPLFGVISGIWLIVSIIMLNVMIITFFYRSVFGKDLKFNIGKAFGSLYLYQLSILAILMLQALKR